MTGSDPSVEFVLRCLAKEVADARELLAAGIELETGMELAISNEVVGELLFTIESDDLDIPADVVQAMHAYLRKYPINLEAVRRQTVELARVFDEHGVEVFFAKGVLWNLLYRESGIIRTTKDVDVYLDKKDIITVVSILERRGYTSFNLPLQESLKHLHHYSIWSPDYGVKIELHWSVAHSRHNLQFCLGQAISRRTTVLIDNQPVPVLNTSDTIVFLALELSKDSWVGMKKLLDFSGCVSSASDEDLKRAVAFARSTGCFRALCISLALSLRMGLVERSDYNQLLANSDRTTIRLADICEKRIRSNRKPMSLISGAVRGVRFAQKHDSYIAQLYHIWRIIVVFRLRRWIGRPDIAR